MKLHSPPLDLVRPARHTVRHNVSSVHPLTTGDLSARGAAQSPTLSWPGRRGRTRYKGGIGVSL